MTGKASSPRSRIADSGTAAANAEGPVVACPQCRQPALYAPANRWRPFCSQRCRLMDLGAWAKDEYRVPGDPLEAPLGPEGTDAIDGNGAGHRE